MDLPNELALNFTGFHVGSAQRKLLRRQGPMSSKYISDRPVPGFLGHTLTPQEPSR